MSEKRALILIDFINEIAHPDGKLSGKGYSAFIDRHATKDALTTIINKFRSTDEMIIHVGVGFSNNYIEHPAVLPLLGSTKVFGALNSTGWGC